MGRHLCWRTLIALVLIINFSCGKKLPELTGIDLAAWKEDKNACHGVRTITMGALKEQKNKLLALDEMEIINLLGRPDENELYKRNQKFYHYFLEPAESCAPSAKKPVKLILRFTAMGLVNEVAVE